ncbi:MAG: hypothetical protein J1E95_08020 [Muribaculaceae bacterium]|nr:hypothetical protein [Muribaculaceae bacterium]
MKVNFKNNLLTAVVCFFLIACNEGGEDITPSFEKDDVEISLSFATRTPTDPGLESYEEYFEEGKSIVLVSQKTTTMHFNFNEESSNCYKYVYYKNETANWDQEYNFRSENPMSWTRILQKGPDGNTYTFGALFYPKGYDTDYETKDEVSVDQSDRETMLKYDILGGFHTTSEYEDRLKFRLYHLMCKLKVNLYIPPYDKQTNNGIDVDDVDASALNFHTDYVIEWEGVTSTEEAPVLKAPHPEIPGKEIKLYKVGREENFNLENIKDNFKDQKIENDIVTKYTFEMLFPQQGIGSSGNILRFVLKRGDQKYNYLFNTTNQSGTISFKFESGSVTLLELYLPREDNEIVLLSGVLHDWDDARAGLTVVETESSEITGN